MGVGGLDVTPASSGMLAHLLYLVATLSKGDRVALALAHRRWDSVGYRDCTNRLRPFFPQSK